MTPTWWLILVLAGSPADDTGMNLTEGRLGEVADGLTITHAVFGPRGRRVAYVAEKQGRSTIVVDGKKASFHHYCRAPVFSPDGQHVAWGFGDRVSPRKERWSAYVDHRKQRTFSWIGDLTFDPAGRRLIYWAGKGVRLRPDGAYGGGTYSVVGHVSKPPAFRQASLAPPVISRRGQIAYPTSVGAGWTVVLGVERQGHYPMVGSPTLHPRDDRVTFAALTPRSRWRVVGAPSPLEAREFDEVSLAGWSPDGRRFAVGARTAKKWRLLLDGRDHGPEVDGIAGRPVFSPDGRRVAYRANRGARPTSLPIPPRERAPPWAGSWFMVVDGKAHPEYDEVGTPVFSPDGQHLAYPARRNASWFIVVDEKEHGPHDAVGPPTFTPDSARVLHGARTGRELWWKVIRP